ncbi:MAG TPA: MarR family transcriptional regulator [Candidatus Blautia avicola]|uniref:MarR family transcriptional regulator n=1 Tax=Candidatus Blautia avicola TaxID=2838483 RepID=A0A9D2QUF1_9FIRM|nr:MarR family transcriptional regulator [Candidatus Blautia avicola]
MNEHFSDLGRYVSIFDRLMKMYYDHGLSAFEIGWGQQFYVEYIYEHPGASPQEMAECIRVDKATLSKIIKKLTEVGYIRVEGDEKDRRMKHLYLTEKALPAAEQIKKIHGTFFEDLQAGISREELTVTENTLRRMADNINKKVWHRMEEHHGK